MHISISELLLFFSPPQEVKPLLSFVFLCFKGNQIKSKSCLKNNLYSCLLKATFIENCMLQPGVGGEGKEIEQGGREENFSPRWEAGNVWIFTLALNPRRSLRGEMPLPLSRSAFSEYLWQPKMNSTMLQGQEITQSSLYMKIHHEGIGTVWVV